PRLCHSLALKDDGTVWAWGWNSNGQLGDGTLVQRITPAQIPAFPVCSGVGAIGAGSSHSLARKSDGTIWAWGLNTSGQVGDGTNTQRTAPVQVHGVGGSGFLMDAMALGAGGNHSLAVTSDGSVF